MEMKTRDRNVGPFCAALHHTSFQQNGLCCLSGKSGNSLASISENAWLNLVVYKNGLHHRGCNARVVNFVFAKPQYHVQQVEVK